MKNGKICVSNQLKQFRKNTYIIHIVYIYTSMYVTYSYACMLYSSTAFVMYTTNDLSTTEPVLYYLFIYITFHKDYFLTDIGLFFNRMYFVYAREMGDGNLGT